MSVRIHADHTTKECDDDVLFRMAECSGWRARCKFVDKGPPCGTIRAYKRGKAIVKRLVELVVIVRMGLVAKRLVEIGVGDVLVEVVILIARAIVVALLEKDMAS
jgi:hypothetical protein